VCFVHRNIWYRAGKVSPASNHRFHIVPIIDTAFIALLVRSLPGSVVERQLQESLSRMFPELLRFSSSSRLLEMVPEELKNAHRPSAVNVAPPPSAMQKRRTLRLIEERDNGKAKSAADAQAAPLPVADVWDGWGDGEEDDDVGSVGEQASDADLDESDDDIDLTEMGL